MMRDSAAIWNLRRATVIAWVALAAAAGCGRQEGQPVDAPSTETTAVDRLDIELQDLDTTAWVRSFDPERSAGGFNLVLYRRRLPMIIDMNGRRVHWWPRVRASGRARLDASGRLSVISTGNAIEEYDWAGRRTWDFRLRDADHLLHHDFTWLHNGNLLVLANDPTASGDYLLEVDRDRREVWRWRFADHRDAFPSWEDARSDPTHANSVFELAPNRWFDAGDERFRPGNLLVSARNLSTVLVIDRESGEVVWTFSDGLDNQHESTMVGRGGPLAGCILLFDNGLEDRYRYRRSRVLAVDPTSRSVVWAYRSPLFFSAVGGTAQSLPGGNVAVCSSRGGRVFEVTRGGDIVWEWVPPYLPMRALRLDDDHCPQLAENRSPDVWAVEPPANLPYVDLGLYQFGLPSELRTVEIAGRKRQVLTAGDECRVLRIPPGASLDAEMGIRAAPDESVAASVDARFRMEVRRGEGPRTLIDLSLATDGEAWSSVMTRDLADLGYSRVRLCLWAEVTGDDDDISGRLVWAQPVIESAILRPRERLSARTPDRREQDFLRRQLEALGYVE